MTVSEALQNVRYVVDSEGRRTDAVVPLAAWQTLLAAWRKSLEQLEDQEDQAVLLSSIEKQAASETEMITLEQLEQELLADGLPLESRSIVESARRPADFRATSAGG